MIIMKQKGANLQMSQSTDNVESEGVSRELD